MNTKYLSSHTGTEIDNSVNKVLSWQNFISIVNNNFKIDGTIIPKNKTLLTTEGGTLTGNLNMSDYDLTADNVAVNSIVCGTSIRADDNITTTMELQGQSLKIGNTTLSETQLKKLLLLLDCVTPVEED